DSHRQDYIEWLRQCPLIHYDADQGYLMVHAGLPPIWNIKTCLERANEVEEILSGEMYKDFLAVMYGDEPAIWDDNLQGMDRIRIITNYFTRLRYCTREGKIELNHKTRKAPQGYRPWFEFDRERMPQIIFGHWAALEGHTGLSHIHALDTGCVWGRTLSALRIDDGQLFSCPAGTSNW
ncbi:MAG: symmetrical bis(5'-nucleosyl)-tetraphosphatase, partial [Gammaproteobacteria bacterium]|nr:symmetrical bis(5'-nucleosyl)-tetraphosphatase [Gammaproteobacteria bacterium]